jgi:hypothetical protein
MVAPTSSSGSFTTGLLHFLGLRRVNQTAAVSDPAQTTVKGGERVSSFSLDPSSARTYLPRGSLLDILV